MSVSDLRQSGLDHLGILTEDIERATSVLCDDLDLELGERLVLDELGAEIQWVKHGQVAIELIAPMDGDGRARRAIDDGQVGLHHLAFRVDDTDRSLPAFRDAGHKTIDEESRAGVNGTRIGFLDPTSTGGIRIELVSGPERMSQ